MPVFDPAKLIFLTLISDIPEAVGVVTADDIDELNLVFLMTIGLAILMLLPFIGVTLFLITSGLRIIFLPGDMMLRALDLKGLITGLLAGVFLSEVLMEDS